MPLQLRHPTLFVPTLTFLRKSNPPLFLPVVSCQAIRAIEWRLPLPLQVQICVLLMQSLSRRRNTSTTNSSEPRKPDSKCLHHTPLNSSTSYSNSEETNGKPSDATHVSSDSVELKESSYSNFERKNRSERLRALWRNPEWRASMLAKRRSKESVQKKSEGLKQRWADPEWRDKMCRARIGRPAPNKGVSASPATRLRMSVAHRGRQKSLETRLRMSEARKAFTDNEEWRKYISESRKGKTKQYFALRREFRALYRDLKLWSDSHRARFGRLPHPDTFEFYVAPMMVFRIRRYLILRDTFGIEEAGIKVDIFS